jgi:hypothetical protein
MNDGLEQYIKMFLRVWLDHKILWFNEAVARPLGKQRFPAGRVTAYPVREPSSSPDRQAHVDMEASYAPEWVFPIERAAPQFSTPVILLAETLPIPRE